MIVAIIPARGGSKRVPRKNIREFHGRPMIAWPIDAAKRSGCFDRIIVSTDDEEIAAIARAWGAETPFLRPVALSDDFTGTTEVVAHSLEWLQDHDQLPGFACCLYATAALAAPGDIREGLALLRSSRADYAFSVAAYAHPVERAMRIVGQRAVLVSGGHQSTRTQDLAPAFHDAGQFYWGSAEAWLGRRPILGGESVAIPVARSRAVDIDSEEDWMLASCLFEALAREDALKETRNGA